MQALQNLLMLTAAKADKGRLLDYIHQPRAFDSDKITQMCISLSLAEETFEINKN